MSIPIVPTGTAPALVADRPKPTGPQVVEFTFNFATYIVSRDPNHGSSLRVQLRGQTELFPVARFSIADYQVVEAQFDPPFCQKAPDWQGVLQELVRSHASMLFVEVTREAS